MAAETQNPQESSATEGTEPGSEEAALKALSQLGGDAEEPDPELPATEEGADADEAESDDSDDPADDPEELVDFEFEGEVLRVTPKQQEKLKGGLLRQSDYSRGMNQKDEYERRAKATLERAELVSASVDKIAEAQGQAALLDAQVQRFEGIDWAGIRQQNPAEYAALQADLLSLTAQRDKALTSVQSLKESLSHVRTQQINAARVEMDKALRKDLKGWGDELGAKISTYALSQGYTTADLSQITDPKVVIALDKARRFDELQNAKLELKSSVRNVPKVVKPGSPRQQTNVAELAKARFNKTRSDDDAIALLEARAKR